MLAVAEAWGHAPAQAALSQSLREEEDMAGWIDAHLKETTLTYLQRSEAGQTAGR